MNEQTLNQQPDQKQSIFKPSEVINIDYWLLHHSELVPEQQLKNNFSTQEMRKKV